MWSHEESVVVRASPAHIWSFFRDVAGWKNWNAGIEEIELTGPFEPGSLFVMRAPGEEPLTSRLTKVVQNKEFTDETVVANELVIVSHRLTELPDGLTRISYATEVSGPDAANVGRLVTADFQQVLASLKAAVEQ